MEEKKNLDEISSAIDFLQKIILEDVIFIKFKKKDGNDRIMKCTLNFSRIPEELRPKGVNLKNILKQIKEHKILKVFDLESMGWRSAPFDRTEWLQTIDKIYSIKKVEELFEK